MQGSPSLLTVKQVATALGIDERSVRDKLTVGTLKGMKKTVGNKDQWFVHQRDLDAELARRGLTANLVQQTEAQTSFQPTQNVSATYTTFSQPSAGSFGSAAETVTELEITDVVAAVNETAEADKATSGGERLNWLNEDMQKQLMATAEIFMQPLVNRIEALTAADKEKDAIIQAKEQELEDVRNQLKLLPDFEKQKADLLKRIEEERRAAEIQHAKVSEKEEEAQKLAAENEQLRVEAEEAKKRAEEAALSLEKLQLIEKQMELLKRPWWKKWFLPAPNEE